jgi:hypothetical protein
LSGQTRGAEDQRQCKGSNRGHVFHAGPLYPIPWKPS